MGSECAKRSFFFFELAAWLLKTGGRLDVQSLMPVLLDVFVDQTEHRLHVKRVNNCKGLATKRTNDALNGEEFQEEVQRRAAEVLDSRAVFNEKNTLDTVQK